MLALAIGCGGAVSKKVTCPDGGCVEAGKDVATSDMKKDVLGDTVVLPDGARPDVSVNPDTNPLRPETAVLDTNPAIDTVTTDTRDTLPVTTPDAGRDTITTDNRLPDTRLPEAGISEVQRDTTPLQGDTLIADGGIDAPPVTPDSADDTADDAGLDAAVAEDTSPDVGEDVSDDAGDDAGDDASDAEIDTL